MTDTTPTTSQTDVSDEQLIENYRSGHDQALDELVRRYQLELFHFLVRFTNDRAAAEDVFQEAFLQVHLSADTFDTSRRFKPWLFTIAANKARDYLRKMARRPASELSAPIGGDGPEGQTFMDLLQADLPMPDDRLQTEELRQRVSQTVQTMPDHLREILLLAYFQQFPYAEIAEMLQIPLGTVKSRLHTAVGTFSQRWKKQNPSPPDA